MVEYLIRWQLTVRPTAPYQTATLSRGYGRRTTGFRIATDDDTAATIGDEPLQLYRKFGRQVRVSVGERRADAIRALERHYPDLTLLLLDDAFQHRYVRPHLNLLLMDYHRPFYADYPFPAGRLRERRRGAVRADAVIVTKCPTDLSADHQQIVTDRIRPYTRPGTPVFFAGLRYGAAVSFAGLQPAGVLDEVVLVSGLANADPLDAYVRQTYRVRQHHRFADHHAYTRSQLERLLQTLPKGASVLTTEKDWVKLDALLTPDERSRLPLYYLPVAVQFLPGHEPAFRKLLEEVIPTLPNSR